MNSSLANALPVHFDPKSFHDAAQGALEGHALSPPGVCMNPYCSKLFEPRRRWQRYCSPSCRQSDDIEMRRIGLKVAPALLAWRMGKHDKVRTTDGLVPVSPELRALSNAGRGYVTRVQSDWFYHRLARARQAIERGR